MEKKSYIAPSMIVSSYEATDSLLVVTSTAYKDNTGGDGGSDVSGGGNGGKDELNDSKINSFNNWNEE